ncbi:MAG: phosphoenolpyruvate synthase [Deltaproteobacteria bacterium]|nr:phosphoenolpyruvate synthase [Deltaproteobacteria bacterium]MBW1952752.1 phosphoenolpyruvate synthase [Deltaproteobacteria bacterium]MBW1986384.1 phosphoenolpyruvate synthase [Deltaproteobacteria bacterium]MBW2133779.1 phosphoenolpyruvate synthase [Deltaproteobacteria bacterium]
MVVKEEKFILWFDEIGINDVPLVGGKNASLGEMIKNLSAKNILVPNGFAITAEAYRYFLKTAGIEKSIRQILDGLDTSDMNDLIRRGKRVRDVILAANLPSALVAEIGKAYEELEDLYGQSGADVDVAVRSSATAEDLPDASFAGQQETFLNVRGKVSLIQAVKKCFASLFTNRAISYRHDKSFDQFDVALSVAVQKMVRSDSACSGVIFSIDTETGFKDTVYITGSYGLGETVVQGQVTPDEFYVFKPTLKMGKRAIVSKKLGDHNIKMVYTTDETRPVRTIATTEEERNRYVLTDDEILTLARWACIIEDHYTQQTGVYRPMDIEWAKDGDGKLVGSGQLFIVQARPETVHAQRDFSVLETYALKERGPIITSGQAVGSKIGQGKAHIIETAAHIAQFRKGEVLVTDMTDPDWEPIMKIAAAIVTNRGGRTCHAAIVSRELGIPCVIGTDNGSRVIAEGAEITVSCSEGETGYVYEGLLPYEVERLDLKALPPTRTKIMMNVGIPEKAFMDGQIPNDGVGLARLEFIINSHIGIHPLALIHYNRLKEQAENDTRLAQEIAKIDERTKMYEDKAEFFIDRLSQGIGRIGAAFYPNDVIVRLSDFKTNEYANLIGGYLFEPEESNPMIGWRGASRYYDEKYKPAFGLECQAFLRAREDMGLTNIKVMVPFCRTPEEGRRVIEVMREYGLVQGENNLEIYVMCEIPSNVILAEEFAQVFDGFSIGSNDLTQLVLGLDRDSDLISHLFDERHPAVKRMVAQVIEMAHKYDRKIGICGQAPSDYPEFATFLVECGIDSISLTPDTVVKTKLEIAKKEKELGITP